MRKLLLILPLILSACSTYIPITSTKGKVMQDKGEACSTHILYVFNTGEESTIDQAVYNGAIEEISYVDSIVTYYPFHYRSCTRVSGKANERELKARKLALKRKEILTEKQSKELAALDAETPSGAKSVFDGSDIQHLRNSCRGQNPKACSDLAKHYYYIQKYKSAYKYFSLAERYGLSRKDIENDPVLKTIYNSPNR